MVRKKTSVGIAFGADDHALVERIRKSLVAQERRATHARLATSWAVAPRSRIVRLALEIAADKLDEDTGG